MKGMMVTLLVLVITGTVIGQQPNQDTARQLGRFILYLNDQDLRMLQANPEGLSAPVSGNAQGKLTEVRLRYGTQPSPAELQSLEVRPGQFNLWLDDAIIADLKDNPEGLVADVPQPLQDKIMEVLIKFGTNPNAQSDGPRANSANNSFGSSRTGSGVEDRTTRDYSMSLEEQLRRSKNDYLNSANNSDFLNQRAGIQDPIYGPPYIPSEQPTRDAIGPSIASNPRFQGQNSDAEFRPRFNTVGQAGFDRNFQVNNTVDENRNVLNRQYADSGARDFRDPSLVGDAGLPKTTLSPIVDNSDLKFQQELIRRERQRLEAERASQAAADRRMLQQQVADEKMRLQNELYLEQLRQDSRASSGNSTSLPSGGFQEPRYASNTRDIIPQATYQLPNRAETNTAADDYEYNRLPPREKFTTPPRIAQKGGVNDYQMSISGPANGANNKAENNAAATTPLAKESIHSNKAYGFIFFMLMLSLGLNLYLAWISRGFYVRYNELADELRETFTSSN